MYIYKMASVEKKNRFRFAVSVEKKKTHGLAKDITKGKQDWTFLLCYPISVASKRIVGKILTAIEGIGLDIMGMRLMCASAKFLTTHFDRDGRNPCPGDSMLHLTRYPFIAMILVLQLTSEISVTKTLNIWAPGRLKAYTSDSFRSAVKDYELWFASDSLFTWRKEVEASKYLACAFPDGTLSGPTDDVRENLVKSEHYIFPPLAFEKQCVGELVSIIERNSFYTKGLKLVRKSEFPDSKAWPASSSGDEKCEFGIGIAMLVRHILPQIQIVNDGDGCICNDGNIGKIKICSNLIYLGEPGDKTMIREFFEFGAVSWVDPASGANCGGYFEFPHRTSIVQFVLAIYLGVNTMIHPVLGILARTMQWWNEKEIRRTVDSKSSAPKSKSWIASMLL
ncbi:hypothetical protein C5167_011471 [Papaver somniferum]|uniref:Uncharacterized protein n=1 Tax=Papaver somniferum TaxID=3469 RepID=A0A4Y7K6E2_PAPSO|nr:hypothetical protein C5167_011471 [Papaver somniferum]